MSTDNEKEVVVAEWIKNAKEIVRVMLQVHRGENVVSIRAWYRSADGELCAGRNGINLRLKHLPKLSKAIKEARKLAADFSANAEDDDD